MKEFKSEIIAFKKDGTLVVFDNRDEYLKEVKSNKGYSRIFASAYECVRQVNDEDTAFAKLSDRLKNVCEEFSINID